MVWEFLFRRWIIFENRQNKNNQIKSDFENDLNRNKYLWSWVNLAGKVAYVLKWFFIWSYTFKIIWNHVRILYWEHMNYCEADGDVSQH